MNHELIMLREAKRTYKLSQSLTKEARYRAVKSHMSQNVKNGTMGQIAEICQLVQLRDDCLLFCRAVSDALNKIDSDKSSLLKQYYFKRVSVQTLAERSGKTVSAVYNLLYEARTQFKKALLDMGCDEQWLRGNFSHIDFISDRLDSSAQSD